MRKEEKREEKRGEEKRRESSIGTYIFIIINDLVK
tara:strand:+ start:360 stop:464 length:105 start_codon:yes stop_codon:yes gene_type:complete